MWVLEDNEIEALGAAQKRNLRETVINHAQDKLQFPPGVDPTQTRGMLTQSYDAAEIFLRRYPDATYRSYVFLTLIHIMLGPEVMSSPEPWKWLNNDRIDIDCRINLAYRIAKDAANGAT